MDEISDVGDRSGPRPDAGGPSDRVPTDGRLGPREAKAIRKRETVAQRVRWMVPVTQPMLLCSQIQRSGGTLLARLFDGHPSCFAHPYELRWGRPEKWNWPGLDVHPTMNLEALLAQLDEAWPREFAAKGYYKYSNWTRRNRREDMRRYPFVFDEEIQRAVFAAAMDRQATRSQRDCLNAYLTSLFNGWLDYQNLYGRPKLWVTAFTPRLVIERDGPDRFFTDYPDGLLVTIVREPCGWLSSFNRHSGTQEVDACIDLWLESADAAVRAHDARPDRVIVVLFEDLVHRTETVMRMLCERMGLAFRDVMLEPTFNGMPVLSDSSHVTVTGIDAAATERHRETLPGAHADRVAQRATPRFEELRERYSSPSTPSSSRVMDSTVGGLQTTG